MVIRLTFKIEAAGGQQWVAGDHGVVFLFFLGVGCVFGLGVAVGFESLLMVSED
jgi:hypothetical protein